MVVNPGLFTIVVGIIAMSKIELRGAKAGDNSDWNQAWKVVSQLAAARGTTLRQIGEDDRSVVIPSPALDPKSGPDSAAISAPFAPVAPDQLARDIAEIEQATAALRRAEPALEPRAPELEATVEPQTSRSIWPLICVTWLAAVLVVSCAVEAIVLLFG
jgi:hypothetical protein